MREQTEITSEIGQGSRQLKEKRWKSARNQLNIKYFNGNGMVGWRGGGGGGNGIGEGMGTGEGTGKGGREGE